MSDTQKFLAKGRDMSISALASGEKSEDPLAKIAKFIPTEIVTLYVAALTIFQPVSVGMGDDGEDLAIHTFDFTSRWVLFFGFLAFTPVMTYLVFRYKVNNASSRPVVFDWWKYASASIYAMLGLAVWATALADTPWLGFEWWKAGISTFVLLAFTTLVPYLPRATVLDNYGDVQQAQPIAAA